MSQKACLMKRIGDNFETFDGVYQEFILSRKVQNVRPATILFYYWNLKQLKDYMTLNKIDVTTQASTFNDVIFEKSNFLSVYTNDIIKAAREILIVSPFVTKRRTIQMMQHLKGALENKVRLNRKLVFLHLIV